LDLLAFSEAILLCTILGIISLRLGFVNLSGLAAALLVGVLIFSLPADGWKWFTVMLIFHGVASQSTRYKYAAKARTGYAQEKGGARSWRNIVANGGMAALLATVEGVWPSEIFVLGYIGAVSTATADTLATEIGLLNRGQPRLITNLRRRVAAGTSGGISPLGEAAALLATMIIGFSVWVLSLGSLGGNSLEVILLVAAASGLAGCTLDSLIGAIAQGIFQCRVCGSMTESKSHCGKQTIHIKGLSLIDNNVVNFIATAFGAAVAAAFSLYL